MKLETVSARLPSSIETMAVPSSGIIAAPSTNLERGAG